MSTATTAPYLVEHIENLGDIDTLVNDKVVAASWPSVDPRNGDQIYVGQIADGDLNQLIADLRANQKAARS
ncbi:hypothetical protein P5V94_25085 [Mycobacteroides abscessus subsp. abscessus]|uniref:hypothetical protein n=1 Tax=Mycobacteroides abscessus TaxID=36809 RepID=UPI0009B10648|nr:hypothetical protein [Mycobacteroides abscessus]MDO3233660.1 hypothetical protein [Mycobacteroides abscessus subsp. abscessus]SLK59670.1 Uncharacterised protein [Mycobacteroides abscessus subsp. abscessus]